MTEFFVAKVTSEWLFTTVGPSMSSQITWAVKTSSAVSTSEGLLISVYQLVQCQMVSSKKSFLWHTSQANGFSLVCVFLCRVKLSGRLNLLGHRSQANADSPV